MTMDIRTVSLAELSASAQQALTRRSAVPDPEMRAAAGQIVELVRQGGDSSLVACNIRYGGGLTSGALRIDTQALQTALAALEPKPLPIGICLCSFMFSPKSASK